MAFITVDDMLKAEIQELHATMRGDFVRELKLIHEEIDPTIGKRVSAEFAQRLEALHARRRALEDAMKRVTLQAVTHAIIKRGLSAPRETFLDDVLAEGKAYGRPTY